MANKPEELTEGEQRLLSEAMSIIRGQPLLAMDWTDVSNAERLYLTSEGRIRWMEEFGVWYVFTFDGPLFQGRWIEDRNLTYVMAEAKACIRKVSSLLGTLVEVYDELQVPAVQELVVKPIIAGIKGMASDTKMSAMIRQTRDMQGVRIHPDDLNPDPYLLGVLNGVVDLRTGSLRDSTMEDFITLQCPTMYRSDVECPTFLKSLSEWQPDINNRLFLQIAVGSAATGYNLPNLIVNVGSGRNGKDTFFNAIMHALGRDVAVVPQRSLFVKRQYEGHSTELATIMGKRMVVASETSEGDRLDEERIKELTSGGYLTARFIRQDDRTVKNTFTIFLHTNNPPRITGTDMAIWERVREVHWDQEFTGKHANTRLGQQLAAEAEGILAWIVEGAKAFIENGSRLWIPEAIAKRTAEYREEQDVIGRFLSDCSENISERFISNSRITELYEEWSREEGLSMLGGKRRKAELRRHGWEDVKQNGIRGMRKVVKSNSFASFIEDLMSSGYNTEENWEPDDEATT